jgi:hypothetical protein
MVRYNFQLIVLPKRSNTNCIYLAAPWLFSTVFNLVKPILSKHTLSKINIFDSNEEQWKAALVQKLPSSAIPEDYGGTSPPVLTVYDKLT